MITKPIIKLIVPISIPSVALASGINSSMHTNIIAPAAKHNANGNIPFTNNKEGQIKRTSLILSEELLYLKFIQGIPIAGIAGGVSDVIYQKKITDYAILKYKRRFLMKHLEEDVVL